MPRVKNCPVDMSSSYSSTKPHPSLRRQQPDRLTSKSSTTDAQSSNAKSVAVTTSLLAAGRTIYDVDNILPRNANALAGNCPSRKRSRDVTQTCSLNRMTKNETYKPAQTEGCSIKRRRGGHSELSLAPLVPRCGFYGKEQCDREASYCRPASRDAFSDSSSSFTDDEMDETTLDAVVQQMFDDYINFEGSSG
ncbi:hypothetical protein HGRIS_008023 [Hohenbuehelia grisea]|uniref:Uncharacterized protein n=1 Tax=Hohenbuehelia grisea TaxID=104357 RepID=A0ABR3J735_9AGAR